MSGGPTVETFFAQELGNNSFVVGDPEAGVAVVVDPVRDVGQYLDRAESLNLAVQETLETHVPNDYISGSRELAAEVGARIRAAPDSGLEFNFDPVAHGGEIEIGRFRLRARHTPGHTPNHLSYLLIDADGRPRALFSGGALMVGAIARTDLFGAHLAVPLALEALRTLQVRLRDLPDDIAIYPTHGAGSFCAAATSKERTSTLANERATNPYLTTHDLMPFLARILHQAPFPAYYSRMAPLNRRGMPLLGRSLPSTPPLKAEEVARLQNGGAAVIDVRPGREYDRGHIPGAYSVGLEGPFSAWVGWIIDIERPVVLTGNDTFLIRDAHRQLLRIGCDGVRGYLDGGIDAWQAAGKPISTFETAEIEDVASAILSGQSMTVIDARTEDEWVHGHVPGALRIPVQDISRRAGELPREVPVAVHCGVGYRAAIAASLLEQAGFQKITHIVGPYSDWDRLHLAATVPG
jgi:hydroxyacylglutathione hydrolase